MLFPEEDAPLLKTWIVKRIENTSDADSDVLADYVIALLKHDGDVDSVRKLCEAEIPDFLTEEPKAFLDDVFQAISYKSYRPGAPPPPKPTFSGVVARPDAEANASSLSQSSASKKRGFQDHAEYDGHDEPDALYGGDRGYKQPRRGSRRGRIEDVTSGRQGAGGGYPTMVVPGLPAFDPKNPMEAIMQMQAMGIPLPGMPEFPAHGFPPNGRNQPRRRGRCRDFDTKGYCARGNTCMYDHGNDSIYVPPIPGQGEEYDPNNAVMTMSHQPPGFMNPYAFGADMSRGRGGRRGRGGKKGGARAAFSAEGPVNDRTKSTIVVENIPEENFSEDEVRGFFSQFGNIVEVSMQPYKHLAIVKYDKWTAANAAYRSPKVIFDNRFVKVFWFKDDEEVLPRSGPFNGANAPKSNGSGGPGGAESVPDIDLEEFQRKQEEAQKQHQEREAKKAELERQRQELEKQQQELLAKHREESERLKAKLAGKSATDTPRNQGSSSATDLLRAQLAALEQEAKILGIDPDAADDASTYSSRGGGAGGGGYRGRGARGGRGFNPRGRGGAFRGQVGRHAAYAQYSIDNRPRKLAVTGVDFTPADKDEMLRHFLLNMGEFESVETSPSVTNVSFQDRKTAEKFYYSLHGKELPGVQGTLDLSWVNTPLPPVGARKATGAGTGTAAFASEDMGPATGDVMAGMDDTYERNDDGHLEERQVDMDYEAVEEGGWVE